jgi:hypothetical protein
MKHRYSVWGWRWRNAVIPVGVRDGGGLRPWYGMVGTGWTGRGAVRVRVRESRLGGDAERGFDINKKCDCHNVWGDGEDVM